LQKDGYETVEEINKLNGELYRAFASLSIEKMEKLWKRCLYTSRLGFIYGLVSNKRKLDNNI
jgi:hypothetical protein